MSGAEFVGYISPSQNVQSTVPATPGAVVEAGRDGSSTVIPCVPTLVDPPDSLVPCDVDLEVSAFDNLMDPDEELEFEEILLRGNFHSARCASPEQILTNG